PRRRKIGGPRVRSWDGNMTRKKRLIGVALLPFLVAPLFVWALPQAPDRVEVGRVVSVPRHLQDGEEYQVSIPQLIRYGRKLFTAMWTSQEGGGRPLTKGTGAPLANQSAALVFPRNFNRISGPDTNSCSGCHNKPDVGG